MWTFKNRLLVFQLILLFTASWPVKGDHCAIYPFYDITPGIDLAAHSTLSISECCQLCQQNIFCAGFTYELDQVENCFLKVSTTLEPATKPTFAGVSPFNSGFYVNFYTEIDYEGQENRALLSNHFQCAESPFTNAKSIDTQGACVRVYENAGCTGRSRSIISPEPISLNLEYLGFPNSRVYSIGLCLPDDVCSEDSDTCPARKTVISPFNLTTSTDVLFAKKSCDPEDYEFSAGFLLFLGVLVSTNVFRPNNPNNPIQLVEHDGRMIRTEYLRAEIRAHHLTQGSRPSTEMRDRMRGILHGIYEREGVCNDDAGHIVACRLGGTGREWYNIFPQNMSINRGRWAQIERLMAESLGRNPNGVVHLQIRFDYLEGSNRPRGFRYDITLADGQPLSGTIGNNARTRRRFMYTVPFMQDNCAEVSAAA